MAVLEALVYKFMSGKFIVIYGINNIGKTTQAKLLVRRLRQEGFKAKYLKYAVYDLKPTGPILNDYLRGKNIFKLSPREFQLIQVINRYQYQPILEKQLKSGIHIVAEDYIGTGIAWGVGAGIRKDFLEILNQGLRREDLAFYLEGQRFLEARETGHRHEVSEKLTRKVQKVFKALAKENHWVIINGNQSIEEIHQIIWQNCQKVLK